MYDDYDLDYTYCNDHSYDLDEYYQLDTQDLDEDYARDSHDYESLAYRHYAWYNLEHLHKTHDSTKAPSTCYIRHRVLWWS